MIFGGCTWYSPSIVCLTSVDLFNLRTNQSTSFGTLTNPVGVHTGGFINGYPFYCGGQPSHPGTPENSCYKFDQSWKKVIIRWYF
jgi:hypothetical protein